VALAITTPLGVIIHTGDFKVDPTPTDNEPFDLHTLAEYGKRGVLLLMSDSTNVDRPGYTESERAVRRAGRPLQSRRAPPGDLLLQLVDSPPAADSGPGAEYGRKVAFLGRSMNNTTEIAHDLGCCTFPTAFCCARRTSCAAARTRWRWWFRARRASRCRRCRAWRSTTTRIFVERGDTVVLSARIIPRERKSHLTG
jgi:ribonuclease J